MEKANIEVFIKSWNNLNVDKDSFNVIVNPSLSLINEADIWIVNKQLKAESFEIIEKNLIDKPNLSICFFLSALSLSPSSIVF